MLRQKVTRLLVKMSVLRLFLYAKNKMKPANTIYTCGDTKLSIRSICDAEFASKFLSTEDLDPVLTSPSGLVLAACDLGLKSQEDAARSLPIDSVIDRRSLPVVFDVPRVCSAVPSGENI